MVGKKAKPSVFLKLQYFKVTHSFTPISPQFLIDNAGYYL